MAVADLIAKANTVPWQTCAACHAMNSLPDAQAAVLVDLLSNSAIKYSELADEINADPDWPISDLDRQALSRHARGRCAAKTKLRGGS